MYIPTYTVNAWVQISTVCASFLCSLAARSVLVLDSSASIRWWPTVERPPWSHCDVGLWPACTFRSESES